MSAVEVHRGGRDWHCKQSSFLVIFRVLVYTSQDGWMVDTDRLSYMATPMMRGIVVFRCVSRIATECLRCFLGDVFLGQILGGTYLL